MPILGISDFENFASFLKLLGWHSNAWVIHSHNRSRTILVSKDVKFSCPSFDICEKFAASCPPHPNAHANVKKLISEVQSPGTRFARN